MQMCGRYGFSIDIEEVRKLVQEVERLERVEVKTGEIFPTNRVPILLPGGSGGTPAAAAWGFPNPYRKGTIINARAETVGEKWMFRSLLVGGRCIVPTTGFYEWDPEKKKYQFSLPGESMLYLAGLWNSYEGERQFVILTTSANESVAGIHDRMPVVLTEEGREMWLHDPLQAAELLRIVPPLLVKEAAS